MRTLFVTLLVLLMAIPLCYAQSDASRPKVAVVLSGGAAKGIAHIGVLKVLEEAGIQPDIITGTSMGSIIGGMYAIGYRADTLEKLILALDWSEVLSDEIPLEKVNFEEKPYFENHLLELTFQDGHIHAPTGLIYGQQVELLLSRLALPAYTIEKFADYPIPFLCVAADIAQGESVILDEGYLPTALRSSMSIPTMFTPIPKDSLLLIDGGLIRNFPVAEAVDMGADIVIGVYTGWKQAELEDLGDLSNIMLQSAFLLSLKDAKAQTPYIDLYIEPDLSGYSASDFNKADSIIAIGERAARAKFEELKNLADSINQLYSNTPKQQLPQVTALHLGQIRVEGNSLFTDDEIIGRSGLSQGTIVGVDDLENAINNLVGTNYFEKVTYQLNQQNGLTILTLKCIEKAPNLIRLAIHYDKYIGAGIRLNWSSRNMIFPASKISFTGTLADNYRYRLDYLKYLGKESRTALVGHIGLTKDEIPIFQNGRQNESFRLIEFLLDARLQKRMGMNHLAGIGMQRAHLFFTPVVSSQPDFSKLNYTNHNAYAFWEMNTLNSNTSPTKGKTVFAEVKMLNNNRFNVVGLEEDDIPLSQDSLFDFDPYLKISANANFFIPLHPKASITFSPFVGMVFNPGNTFGDFYLIGAPTALTRRSIPFYGLNANQLVAQFALGSGIGYQHRIRRNLFFSVDANIGWFSPPDINEQRFTSPSNNVLGFGTSIAYDSFLGPAKFTIMYPIAGDDLPNQLNFFLSIGHRF